MFLKRRCWAILLAGLVCVLARSAPAQTAHAGGGAITIGSGFNGPFGVAVDASGDVFVADTNHHAVKEIVAVNGVVSTSSTVKTIYTSSLNPFGVAVDASGDVFVADWDNTASNSAVKEIVAVNGMVSSSSTVKTIGSGFILPTDVAVDASGDVFVSDEAGAAYEIVASNGVVSSSSTVKTIGSGFGNPFGVAVDASGDVFVGDYFYNAVKEIVAANGVVSSTSTVNTVGSVSSSYPYFAGVAVDAGGDVFVGDGGNGAVKEIVGAVHKFPATAAGSASASISVPFTFDSGGSISAPVVLTKGAVGKDFADTGLGTCDTLGTNHAYSAGDFCTVDVTFTPSAPGERLGAVQLKTNAGAVIATALVSGTGTGPLVTFPSNSAAAQVGSGFSLPQGVAVDASGDVFVANPGSSAVKEVVAVNGMVSSSSSVTTVGSGFAAPLGVAVDASGDVFVADQHNNTVNEIVAVNGLVSSSSTVKAIGGVFNSPNDVAVDARGDVFVADGSDSAVEEVVAVNGMVSSSSTVKPVGSGFSGPMGVAVDASGDVFVADYGANAVKEIVAVNGLVSSSSTVKAIGSGFSNPEKLAVDASGNVFVADTGNNTVKEIVAINGLVSSSSTVKTIGGSFAGPDGVAMDASGDLFVANNGNSVVTEAKLGEPPSLTFAATDVGSRSSDSPQTVAIANSGNAALTFPVPATGNNPNIATNFTLASGGSGECTPANSTNGAVALAPGASCALPINFVPQSGGAIIGSLVLTDNQANATAPAYTTQTIPLSGTGVESIASFNITGAATAARGAPVTMTVTALDGLNHTDTGYPGTIQFSTSDAQAALPANYTFTAADHGVHTFPVTLNTAGSQTVMVDDTSTSSASGGATVVVSKTAATVTLGGLSATYDGSAHYTPTVTTAPAGLTVDLTYNGSSTAPAGAGTYFVEAAINDVNYQGSASGTLVIAPAAATVTLSGLRTTYDGAAHAATATTAPAGLTVDLTYNGASTAPTAAGAYAVAADVNDANYEGSASGTLVIAPAAATVTLGGLSAAYDGQPHAATATTSPAGLTVGLTYDGSASAPTAAGSYAVVADVNDPNYRGSASGTLVIAPAAATVTLAGLRTTYDGQPHAATATTSPAGLTVGLTYDGSATAPTAAGISVVSATVNSANYQGSATGTLVIAPAAATVALGGLSAAYDGQPHAATVTTSPAGLAADLTYNGSTSAPTAAGSYAVVAEVNDPDYQGQATGVLTISPPVAAGSAFSIKPTGPAIQEVAPGGTATFHLALAPAGGAYPAAVSLTALGVPPNMQATFSPTTLAADAGATTVTMTVKTSSLAALDLPFSGRQSGGLALLGVLFLPWIERRKLRRLTRRRGRKTRAALLLLTLGVSAGLSACGGMPGPQTQAPESYTIVVAASSGAVEQFAQVTLQIQ